MDASIQDKVFLFLCERATKCLNQFRSEEGDIDRSATWQAIRNEVPIIRAWLLNTFKTVPGEFKDDRFGIRAWHHPELMAELSNMSPEARLLSLIDSCLFDEDTFFMGKAMDIEKKLRESKFSFEVEKLLKFSSACGTYLARLEKTNPERFTGKKFHGTTFWTINKPSTTED